MNYILIKEITKKKKLFLIWIKSANNHSLHLQWLQIHTGILWTVQNSHCSTVFYFSTDIVGLVFSVLSISLLAFSFFFFLIKEKKKNVCDKAFAVGCKIFMRSCIGYRHFLFSDYMTLYYVCLQGKNRQKIVPRFIENNDFLYKCEEAGFI